MDNKRATEIKKENTMVKLRGWGGEMNKTGEKNKGGKKRKNDVLARGRFLRSMTPDRTMPPVSITPLHGATNHG